MKVHVLVENTTCRSELTAEHGLSLLVETDGGKRILFDTGASGAFAANAERMGLDIAGVDVAVLSHGHDDHGGGLPRFLELNSHAPVWVSPHAFERHFNASGREIGLEPALREHPQVRCVPQEVFVPMEGMKLYRCGDMVADSACADVGMTVQTEGMRQPEDFRHELYMLLEEKGRRILFSGCSHRGVSEIARRFRPDVFVGGFHCMRMEPLRDAELLRRMGRELPTFASEYWTGHCTGEYAYRTLRAQMGDRLHALSTGLVVEL